MNLKLRKGLAVRQTNGGRQCENLSYKFWLCLDFRIHLVLLQVWHWRYPFFSLRNRRSVVVQIDIDRVKQLSKASFGLSTYPHLDRLSMLTFDKPYT